MSATVLVVEDDASVRRSLVRLLAARGYSAVPARNGATVLEDALRERPAVVLMDLHMPRNSGIEIARTIRQHAELRDVALIALSASSAPEEALRPLFDQVLVKPCASQDIVTAIRTAMQ